MALFDTATGKRIKELRLQDGRKIARLYRTSDNALLFNSGDVIAERKEKFVYIVEGQKASYVTYWINTAASNAVQIEWGDGIATYHAQHAGSNIITHNYAQAGTYHITVLPAELKDSSVRAWNSGDRILSDSETPYNWMRFAMNYYHNATNNAPVPVGVEGKLTEKIMLQSNNFMINRIFFSEATCAKLKSLPDGYLSNIKANLQQDIFKNWFNSNAIERIDGSLFGDVEEIQLLAQNPYDSYTNMFANNPISDMGSTKFPIHHRGTNAYFNKFIGTFKNCYKLRSIGDMFYYHIADNYKLPFNDTFALDNLPEADEGLTSDNLELIKSISTYNTDAKILASVDGSDTANTGFRNQWNLFPDVMPY